MRILKICRKFTLSSGDFWYELKNESKYGKWKDEIEQKNNFENRKFPKVDKFEKFREKLKMMDICDIVRWDFEKLRDLLFYDKRMKIGDF